MTTKTNNHSGAGSRGPRRHTAVDRDALAATSGTVTELAPQRRDPKRRSVSVDGRFVLSLHEEAVVQAGIRLGASVNGAQLLRAYDLDQVKAARDAALLLLAIASRSERDVARKLLPRFGSEATEATLAWLLAGGWLNDGEFARGYIRAHGSYGAHRLAGELARRGVAREVAQAAIAEVLGEVDGVKQAREAAASRLTRMGQVDRDTARRRLAGFLGRRGFDFATVAEALAPLLADLPRTPRSEGDREAGSAVFTRRSSLKRSRTQPSRLRTAFGRDQRTGQEEAE